jgi:hypothetical protein
VSARLGLSIASDSCAAVLVRRGRIRWHRRVTREPGSTLAATVHALLESRRESRRRADTVVTLGASYSQVKRVAGIPPTLSRDVATRLVRENASSFFLVSSRLATTGLQRAADGSAWTSALDAGLIDEVRDALRAIGVRAREFVADAVALACVLPAGEHRMRDGDVFVEFATEHAALTRCRRSHHSGSFASTPSEPLPAPLRELGDEARQYVAALAAATLPLGNPLAWRPPPDPRRRAHRRRIETAIASIGFAASIVAAAAAPGIRATRDAARWTRQSAVGAAIRRESATVDAELGRVTNALDRLDRFQATRGDAPRLLGNLALALPESTALLSLHVDTVEIDFAVLTPHAADVIPQLADVGGVVSPRIVGSVVRDASARVTLERATIRARRRREIPSRGRGERVSTIAAGTP